MIFDLWSVMNGFFIVLNSFSFILAPNDLFHQSDFVKCVKTEMINISFIIFAFDIITGSRDTKFSTFLFDWVKNFHCSTWAELGRASRKVPSRIRQLIKVKQAHTVKTRVGVIFFFFFF